MHLTPSLPIIQALQKGRGSPTCRKDRRPSGTQASHLPPPIGCSQHRLHSRASDPENRMLRIQSEGGGKTAAAKGMSAVVAEQDGTRGHQHQSLRWCTSSGTGFCLCFGCCKSFLVPFFQALSSAFPVFLPVAIVLSKNTFLLH